MAGLCSPDLGHINDVVKKLPIDTGLAKEIEFRAQRALSFIVYDELNRQQLVALAAAVAEMRDYVQLAMRRNGNFLHLIFY